MPAEGPTIAKTITVDEETGSASRTSHLRFMPSSEEQKTQRTDRTSVLFYFPASCARSALQLAKN
jgi:hypothetical protein